MASPRAAGEAPALSACFTAIQNSPLASAMTIAAPTHWRILDFQISSLDHWDGSLRCADARAHPGPNHRWACSTRQE